MHPISFDTERQLAARLLDVLHGTRQTGQFYGPDGQASAGSALRGGVLA